MSGFTWSSWRRMFFPRVCLICDVLVETEDRICDRCKEAIGNDPHFTCPRCSSTVGEFAEVSDGCSRCNGDSFAFDEVLRLGLYDGLLREAILRIKASSGESLAETIGCHFAEWRAARFAAWKADWLVPVPLHWWREWQRGYNQSDAIAQGIGEKLKLPVRSHGLKRIRWTRKQFELTPTQRQENVRGAFRVNPSFAVRGSRILLVDDVLTTGGTLHECAKVLKEAGAIWVGGVVLGHR